MIQQPIEAKYFHEIINPLLIYIKSKQGNLSQLLKKLHLYFTKNHQLYKNIVQAIFIHDGYNVNQLFHTFPHAVIKQLLKEDLIIDYQVVQLNCKSYIVNYLHKIGIIDTTLTTSIAEEIVAALYESFKRKHFYLEQAKNCQERDLKYQKDSTIISNIIKANLCGNLDNIGLTIPWRTCEFSNVIYTIIKGGAFKYICVIKNASIGFVMGKSRKDKSELEAEDRLREYVEKINDAKLNEVISCVYPVDNIPHDEQIQDRNIRGLLYKFINYQLNGRAVRKFITSKFGGRTVRYFHKENVDGIAYEQAHNYMCRIKNDLNISLSQRVVIAKTLVDKIIDMMEILNHYKIANHDPHSSNMKISFNLDGTIRGIKLFDWGICNFADNFSGETDNYMFNGGPLLSRVTQRFVAHYSMKCEREVFANIFAIVSRDYIIAYETLKSIDFSEKLNSILMNTQSLLYGYSKVQNFSENSFSDANKITPYQEIKELLYKTIDNLAQRSITNSM